jgi:hypothetical protein
VTRAGLQGAAAALAALAVMVGLVAVGLYRLEVGGVGAVAAGVALAAGGSVELLAGGGFGAELRGGLSGMPLGVSLAGAAVLVVSFQAPLRRRAVGREELAVRVAAAVGTFVAGVGVLALVGQGRLPIGRLGEWGRLGEPDGAPFLGRERRSREAVTPELGQGSTPGDRTVQFHTDLAVTLGAGLLWVVVVLVVGWLVVRRAPLPSRLTWVHRVRPALSATVTVVLVLVVDGTLVGLLVGGPLGGGLVLGAGTGVVLVLTLGIGVPWSAPVPVGEVLPVVFAAFTLLACGLLGAAWAPVPVLRWRAAVGAGLLLGVAVATTVAALTFLARVSVDFGVRLFGSQLLETELSLRGNVLLALVLGLGGGFLAGAGGHLLMACGPLRRRRARSSPDRR